MPQQHPSMHTFTKPLTHDQYIQLARSFFHLGVVCERCKLEGFNGVRYQCNQCESSYDLCEECIGKAHRHHTFKIVPNLFIRAGNNSTLAARIVAIAEVNKNAQQPGWRDPFTGWTVSDAKSVLKRAEKDMEDYQTQVKTIKAAQVAAAENELQQAVAHSKLVAKLSRDALASTIAATGGHVTYVHHLD